MKGKVVDPQQFQHCLETSSVVPTLGAALQQLLSRERDQPPLDQLRGILGNPAAVQLQGQVTDLKARNSGLEKQLEDLRKQATAQRKAVPPPGKLKK